MRASKAIRSVLRAVTSSVGPDRIGSKNGHAPYRYSAFDLLRHGISARNECGGYRACRRGEG